MTDLRKAAEMALEALDCLPWQASPIAVEATKALRTALAQTEQECVYPQCETAGGCDGPCGEKPVDTVKQEPVAWMNPRNNAVIDARKKKQIGEGDGYPRFSVPLYAQPVDTVNTSQERETAKRGHEVVEVYWSANKQVCFKVGWQTFRLDHFVDAEDEFEFMKKLLLLAFTNAAPPKQWVGLTDEEIGVWPVWSPEIEEFVRTIEAKLKGKNT